MLLMTKGKAQSCIGKDCRIGGTPCGDGCDCASVFPLGVNKPGVCVPQLFQFFS